MQKCILDLTIDKRNKKKVTTITEVKGVVGIFFEVTWSEDKYRFF